MKKSAPSTWFETKVPFTLHKEMGPNLLISGPDQFFFLTVYTDNNQVRLMTEKSPNMHTVYNADFRCPDQIFV